jgi:hypothetical protein
MWKEVNGKKEHTKVTNKEMLEQMLKINGISIENNIISALGYKYDKSFKSITIGSDYNSATGYLSFT